MFLSLSIKEQAALTLHMSIMRKSFRNIIKKKYSKEKKEYLASYDFIHNEVKNKLEESTVKEIDYYTIGVNIRDLEILTEFLRAYLQKIDDDKALNKAFSETDKEQLKLLSKLRDRCDKMLKEIRDITA